MKQKAKRELLHVKVEGMNYHLDGGGQKIFFRGEWLEVMADQEGFLYIHPSGQKTIYLDDESQPEDVVKEACDNAMQKLASKEPAGELFTPGEWEVNPFKNTMIQSDNGEDENWQKKAICGFFGNPTEKEIAANIQLVAQAKNMYYALKELVSIVRWQDDNIFEDQKEANEVRAIFEKSKSILKKVTNQ